jgi:hypothetical protein
MGGDSDSDTTRDTETLLFIHFSHHQVPYCGNLLVMYCYCSKPPIRSTVRHPGTAQVTVIPITWRNRPAIHLPETLRFALDRKTSSGAFGVPFYF